ncbi:MAG: hypothetical protein JWO44_773 [Bacteroidetes bacterium]|jgi:hypothetical protein|nr:hypothetical protein [Bacteroidota bacterium]
MKKCLFVAILLFFSVYIRAQTPATSPIIYKMKINGVNTAVTAKEISPELSAMFDSDDQSFSASDSTITLKSAFDAPESKFIFKLTELGYVPRYFRKISPAPTGLER